MELVYKMVLNKMESLFGKSSAWLCARMSSDPERQSKAHGDKGRIIRFRIAFALFYLVSTIISWWIIISCLKSAGFFEKIPQSCLGPREGEGLRENVYPALFLFDFHAFLSESNELKVDHENQSIWTLRKLINYSEKNKKYRKAFSFSTNVSISEVSDTEALMRNGLKLNPEIRSLAHPKQRQSLPARLPHEKRLPSRT